MYVKYNNTYIPLNRCYMKVNGEWVEAKYGYGKVNGEWVPLAGFEVIKNGTYVRAGVVQSGIFCGELNVYNGDINGVIYSIHLSYASSSNDYIAGWGFDPYSQTQYTLSFPSNPISAIRLNNTMGAATLKNGTWILGTRMYNISTGASVSIPASPGNSNANDSLFYAIEYEKESGPAGMIYNQGKGLWVGRVASAGSPSSSWLMRYDANTGTWSNHTPPASYMTGRNYRMCYVQDRYLYIFNFVPDRTTPPVIIYDTQTSVFSYAPSDMKYPEDVMESVDHPPLQRSVSAATFDGHRNIFIDFPDQSYLNDTGTAYITIPGARYSFDLLRRTWMKHPLFNYKITDWTLVYNNWANPKLDRIYQHSVANFNDSDIVYYRNFRV